MDAYEGLAHATALQWSVHEGFVDYVTGLPDGRIAVSDPATRDRTNSIRFPIALPGDGSRVAFAGSVEFVGHGGMLSVLMAEPVVARRADRIVMSIVDDDVVDTRTDVVSLNGLQAAGSDLVFNEVALTAEGAELFFGQYAQGTPFAPVLIRLSQRS